jgi:uncharacterized protein YegL
MSDLDFIRRRPIYLLIDTSNSMQGAPIQAAQQGVQLIHNELNNNPHAIETVYLSIITFSDTARQIVTLSSVENFTPPVFKAGGSTAMGAALTLLDQAIEREVRKATAASKADYRPLVFLLTDGAPTDEWRSPSQKLKARTDRKIGSLVALACGPSANVTVLREITNDVLLMSDTSPDAIRQFFRWVSSSIQKTSQRLDTQTDAGALEIVALPDVVKWTGKETS